MSLAARCIEAIATGVVAADLPGKARAHVERRASAKRRAVKPMKRERLAKEAGVKAARRDRVAKLRAEVFEHWLGDCAVCLATHRKMPATDMHHVLSGPLRRLRESKGTVLPVCGDHHRLLHRNDLDALLYARLVCEVEGMNEAADALDRRIAKVNEARAAQGRP